MATKKKAAKLTAEERIQNLIWDYSFISFPYDLAAKWTPLSTVLSELNIHEKIAFSYFRRLELICECGNWQYDLADSGIFAKISFTEEDIRSEHFENIELTLVSDRGAKFIEEFFSMDLEELIYCP
jgi:hypothetical protein